MEGYVATAMRLHSAKIPQLAREIVDALITAKDIETSSPAEVRQDITAVLEQYVRDEQEINDKARELMAARGMPPSELGRLRRVLAEERGVRIGDETIDYLLDQLLEILMHSNNVDEVFAEDITMRRHMREPLRRHANVEEQLQTEVRNQLKHVKEGSAIWEVEYRRMLEDIKRRKGLS